MHASNNGLSAISIKFNGNYVIFDGAALVIYATNYGYAIRYASYTDNVAGRNGGKQCVCICETNNSFVLLYLYSQYFIN